MIWNSLNATKDKLYNFFSPESADTSSLPVEEGDLILLATDGLFDNLPESFIVQQLSKLRVILNNFIMLNFFYFLKCIILFKFWISLLLYENAAPQTGVLKYGSKSL